METSRGDTGAAPEAFVGMDQKERAIVLVNRQPGWLLGVSRHEVSVCASRINAGDAVWAHGCA